MIGLRGGFAGAVFAGAWLIFAAATAKADVVVSRAATQNMSCSGGVCAPTAANAILNVGDLENLLSAGDVEVTTVGTGVQAANIQVEAPLTWSSSSTLSLDAEQSITVTNKVSVAGAGGLTIVTDDQGSGGYLSFGQKGQVTFADLGSPLTINGTAFMLVGDVASLASAEFENPYGSFALANDYNAVNDGTYNGPPVGNVFGEIEGLGNTISHLSIRQAFSRYPASFIEVIGIGAFVSDLRLDKENMRVKKGSGAAFGLAIENDGTVSGVAVNANLVGRPCGCIFAGLLENNEGIVTRSSANFEVVSYGAVSGLVYANEGSITYSHASGSISYVKYGNNGGLVGTNSTGATISDSFASVDIIGVWEVDVGGLVGADEGNTSNSYATGMLTGNGNALVGGLEGYASGTISASYSTGSVNGENSVVGGFVGEENNATCSDCYWNTTTSGTNQAVGEGSDAGMTGLTTEELQSGLPDGFDKKTWRERTAVNTGFPYLRDNPPPKK